MKANLFADDLTLLCRGKNQETVNTFLQRALDNIIKWVKETGFKFSKSKSKCISFSNHKQKCSQPDLYLEGEKLQTAETIKVLGLTFDKKLTWIPHLKELRTDCRRRLNILRSLSSQNWGADQAILLQTYKAVIQSKIDYGAIVYNSASSTAIKMLDSIQCSALRIATGAYHTSPTTSLQIESDEMSLESRRKLLTLRYALKTAVTRYSSTYTCIFSNRYQHKYQEHRINRIPPHLRVNKYCRELHITIPSTKTRNIHCFPPWILSKPQVKLDLSQYAKSETSNVEFHSLYNEIRNTHSNHVAIFTDGSKSSDGNGCAMIMENEVNAFKLPDILSIFSCELYALKQSLLHMQNKEHNKFIIFSDSLSSIIALGNVWTVDKFIQDIQILYHTLKIKGKEIIFIWISYLFLFCVAWILPNSFFVCVQVSDEYVKTGLKYVSYIALDGYISIPN